MKMNFIYLIIVLLSMSVVAFAFRPKSKITVSLNSQAGDLTVKPCDYKTKTQTYRADCGTIVVPENRLNPTSRLIALPVKRIHAQGGLPGEPIVYFGGGPGMSNMRFEPPDELLVNHDVLLVGYRGVDGSSVLDCPEFSRATLGDGKSVFSDKSLAIMTDAVRACQASLEADGVDLSGYTIQQVIEDVEMARVALGYEKVNLLSESYGTRVAQVYAALHPKSLNRSAMIGVNPPGRFVWEPEMVDAQIEYYSQLWTNDQAASTRTGNLVETMRKVSHNMPRRWLFFPIDPDKVNAVAFVLFFNRKTSAMVFDTYIAAERGDASGLALMSMAYDLVVPKSFVWGDFFMKGGSADLDPNRDYVATLRRPDTIMGSPISLLIWGPLSQAWPQNKYPVERINTRETDVETLLISGSVDFSTPAQYARQELLPSLKNGQQVILSEMGHVSDVWSIQPKATKGLLMSFYDTGHTDKTLYQYSPMDFRVRLGYPLLAKILFGTGIMIAISLMFAVRRLVLNRKHNTDELMSTKQ